jgi:hypothetical protein
MTMGLTWPLVGRDDELLRLGEAMDALEAGVVLAGPPGARPTRCGSPRRQRGECSSVR